MAGEEISFGTNTVTMNGTTREIVSSDNFGFAIIDDNGERKYYRYSDFHSQSIYTSAIERNNKLCEQKRAELEILEGKMEKYKKAKSENGEELANMRREYGMTLSGANEEEHEVYDLTKESFYSNSMNAVIMSNTSQRVIREIGNLNVDSAKKAREMYFMNQVVKSSFGIG